jgi:hypothetical protein
MAEQIEIRHTHADGTLAVGTRKGDGSAEVLKGKGWRWSRSLTAWYIPRSRDELARTAVIQATADALKSAGFDVTTEIDESVTRSVEEQEDDRASRAQARAEMLQDRAERHREAAAGAWNASRRISDGIPLGQPILVGHHSERRHRRDLERMQNLASRSAEESRSAEADQRRADALAGATEFRYSVKSVGRRIGRLEAELRKVGRQLEGYTRTIDGYKEVHAAATGDWAERLRVRQTDLRAQIDYWRGVGRELAEARPTYSQETIKKGDYVRICGSGER